MKTIITIKVVLMIKLMTHRRYQPQKKLYSMIKKLNNFLLTRKLNPKYLKGRSINSVKVICMLDHAKPAVRDFNPDHIVLHCATNDLNFDRRSIQIVIEITILHSH